MGHWQDLGIVNWNKNHSEIVQELIFYLVSNYNLSEEENSTSSKGNFTGVIALTRAAGSKGGASPGEMCTESLAGHAQEEKI